MDSIVMRFISMLFKICVALILGLVVTLYSMQYTPQFKKIAGEYLKSIFEISFNCKASGTVHSIGILVPSPYIVLTNLQVTPKHGSDWSWECERFIVSCSWLDILWGAKIGIMSEIYQVKATSLVDEKKVSIMDHVGVFLNVQKDLPLELRTLYMHKGTLQLHDAAKRFFASCTFESDISNLKKRRQALFHIQNGTLRYYNHIPVTNACLRIFADSAKNNGEIVYAGTLQLPKIDPSLSCYFSGWWKQNKGFLQLYNKERSFAINQCTTQLTDDGVTLQADFHVPLGIVRNLLPEYYIPEVQGDCQIQFIGNFKDLLALDAKIAIKHILMKNYNIGSIDADLFYKEGDVKGNFSTSIPDFGNPSGTCSWSTQQGVGTFQFSNTATIERIVGDWHSAASDIVVTGTINNHGIGTASYSCCITDAQQENKHIFNGSLKLDPDHIQFKGMLDDFYYTCTTGGLKNFYLDSFELCNDKSIISIIHDKSHGYRGVFSCEGVRSLIMRLCQPVFCNSQKEIEGFDTQIDGTVMIVAKQVDNAFVADLSMKKGNIRLGTIYNFIQDCTGKLEIVFDKRSLSLKNCFINLHRGQLLMSYARCIFDGSGVLNYCYIPVHLNSVFLSIERDLFVLVSGHIVIIKKGKRILIKGDITIDRGQMLHSIFSAKEQKNIAHALSTMIVGSQHSGEDVEFDITIESKHPIHVQTGFLESNIKPNLSLQGSLHHPHIAGKIFITDGIFRFPYRQLSITHGALYIMPHTAHDPAIELHAKGRVKRYMIHMHVNGTLRDPHISFSSTPSLTQEQIITLLLGGSETGSLSFVMPSLVMQNMQNLIFGSGQTSETVQKFLLPLHYVRIVPSFTDQAGRGGFRGALEIDVTDQLRAVIQRNFSLPEDTRFEVEYQISDEISLRGLKDERSDIGGEVEMRFTF